MPTTTTISAPKASQKAARWITEVFAPTVLVAVFLLIQPFRIPGASWIHGVVAAVFVVGLPFLVLLWMKKRGSVTDHHVRVREQRAPIFIIAAISLGVGTGVLWFLDAPLGIFYGIASVFLGLVLCFLSNLVWKLSVHAAVAAYIALDLLAPLPTAGPALALLLASAVGWSRIKLGDHTPTQVLAGQAVGCLVYVVSLILS